jgi:hypothetical protein
MWTNHKPLTSSRRDSNADDYVGLKCHRPHAPPAGLSGLNMVANDYRAPLMPILVLPLESIIKAAHDHAAAESLIVSHVRAQSQVVVRTMNG